MGGFGIFQLFLCVAMLVIVQASVIKFQAYPSELKANLTNSASMRCSLADNVPSGAGGQIGRRAVTSTPDDILHITSIQITRNNGADVAYVATSDAAMAEADIGNLEVKGDVRGTSATEGYLELTWKAPSTMAMGEYVCEITAVMATHHKTVVLTSTLEMTEVAPTVLDVIIELKTIQGELKTTQGELKTTQGELKQTENDLNELKAKQDDQVKTNVKVQNCMSRRAGFMSVISSTFNGGYVATFAANKPVVFDKVIYSSGGGYDSQTGLFTCSVSGEYHFSVHALSAPSQAVHLELRLNSKTVAHLYVYGLTDVGSGTEGAVLHLNKNDVVSVVSGSCCTSGLWKDANLVQSNVFTGHLIHSDDCLV